MTYKQMTYRQCGHSGLWLPAISLGLWHNFGDEDPYQKSRAIVMEAFDRGVTHFDLANNYGPPPGAAELTFGRIMREGGLGTHRDEIVVTSKAGHLMWNGPYGDGGSRKHIMASIDQSLRRTGLEYFDIFYSHRHTPETPLEETVQALVDIVKQGKALYVGLSKYPPEVAERACHMLESQNVRCLVYQDRYNMFDRHVAEDGHFEMLQKERLGFAAFSPLAQGLLTDRYLGGIPEGSRASRASGYLKPGQVTTEVVDKVRRLSVIARNRGQSVAQMALAWLLSHDRVTTVIIGASSLNQLDNSLSALDNIEFTEAELQAVDSIMTGDS